MIEIIGKSINLRTMNQKEMRALWRKYEPETGAKKYIYDEQAVDLKFQRAVEREEWNPSVGIFLKNDEIIGELTFIRIVYSENRCELGLFMATAANRGKGFEAEAIKLAMGYAKDKFGLSRIYADVSTKNLILQNALTECGFRHTKTFKGGYSDGGDRMSFVAVL